MPVGHEVDRSVNEQAEKLGQIFVAVKQLDQHQEKKELGAVSQQEGSGKKQHLMPDAVFLPSASKGNIQYLHQMKL